MKTLIEEPIIAIQDICVHYQPDKKRPIGEQSSKQGQLYECQSFHSIRGETGCVNCYNHQNPDGSFQHHAERVRDGIADFQIK